MQWLNKLDQVLDSVFQPISSNSSSPVRGNIDESGTASDRDLVEMMLDYDEDDDLLLEDAEESSLEEMDIDYGDQRVSIRVTPFQNSTSARLPGMIRPVVRPHEDDSIDDEEFTENDAQDDSSDDEEFTENDAQKDAQFPTAYEGTIPKYVETTKEGFQVLDNRSPMSEVSENNDSKKSGTVTQLVLGSIPSPLPPPSPLATYQSQLLIEAAPSTPLQVYPTLGMNLLQMDSIPVLIQDGQHIPLPPPPTPSPPSPLLLCADEGNTISVQSSPSSLIIPPTLPPPPPTSPQHRQKRQKQPMHSQMENTVILSRTTPLENHVAEDVPSTVSGNFGLNESSSSILHGENPPILLEPDQTFMDESHLQLLTNIERREAEVAESGVEDSLGCLTDQEAEEEANAGLLSPGGILIDGDDVEVIPVDDGNIGLDSTVLEGLAQPHATTVIQRDIPEISIVESTAASTTSVAAATSGGDSALKYHTPTPQKLEAHAFQAAMGDFLLTGYGSDEYGNSEDSDESNMTTVTDEEWDDYVISEPICAWSSKSTREDDVGSPLPPFHPSMNCPGVVHVRLLRAQRLPCAPGAALQTTISLPPWKGRIRSKRVISYDGPDEAIICARWDQASNDEISITHKAGDGIEETGVCAVHSMLHAYNNEDTPIPSIRIEIKDLALQMFETGVCSLTLSCEPLMRNSGVFKRQWCVAEVAKPRSPTKKSADMTNDDDDNVVKPPLILIEACFESMNFNDRPTQNQDIENLEVDRGDDSLSGDVISTFSHDDDVSGLFETASIASSSARRSLPGISTTTKRFTSKQHMLRITSSWKPTYCAVCSAMIVWGLKGYQCEVCKLVCCTDCQLRVDVELPCGSELAEKAVQMALKPKVNVNKLFSVLAPIKEHIFDEKGVVSSDGTSQEEEGSATVAVKEEQLIEPKETSDGVGTFDLRILKACLFRRTLSPETELNDILKKSDRWLRYGDHYARISWTGNQETKRTRTIFQTAKPRFESEEMSITAMHHGTEFRIEVFDAAKDKPVGCTLLSTQGLLQWQRDELEKEGEFAFTSTLTQKPMKAKKRKRILELRTGVKKGFGLDFYNAGKSSGTIRSGEISGWIEVEMCFKEDPYLFSNTNPKIYPDRPPDDFNVDLIQLHIARIGSLVEEVTAIYQTYFYVVSWENPALTGLSLIIFVFFCLRFNAEYFGSLPIAMIFCYMLYCAYDKKSNGFRSRLIRKERDARLEEEKVATIDYDEHRPISWLNVKVLRGKHLSTEHGIPGSMVSDIFVDTSRLVDDKTSLIKCDATSKSAYHIGTTESSGVTFSPVWESIRESHEFIGLKKLLPSSNVLTKTDSRLQPSSDANDESVLQELSKIKTSIHFPLLQPISGRKGLSGGTTSDEGKISVKLLPWESSVGAVVFQVRFADVLNRLPLFDDTIGEVVIPLERIARARKIKGWFKVLKKGTRETIEIEPEEADSKPTKNDNGNDVLNNSPMILLEAEITFPDEKVTDIDRETSIVVAEEMIKSASLSQDTRVGIIGTSISTFNTVRGVTGNVQYLQNQLGSILDMMEMLRNAFNFSCQEKSALILLCLLFVWLLLALIPTKLLFLCAGLVSLSKWANYSTRFMLVV